MRIGVSGWRLSGQPLGVSGSIEYVRKNGQCLLGDADDATLYVSAALSDSRRDAFGRLTVRNVRPKLTNGLWEHLLPRHARGRDVLVGPGYTLSLTYRGRCVVARRVASSRGPMTAEWTTLA